MLAWPGGARSVHRCPGSSGGLSPMCGLAGPPGGVGPWLDRSLPSCWIEECAAVVVIGVDSHKRTQTVVAVDGVGRKLGERTVRVNRDGHLELLRWAARFTDVSWAVEDCRNLTRRFEGDMLG